MTWTSMSLDELADVVGRGIAPSYSSNGGWAVLNQKCVRGGRLDTSFARSHDSTNRPVALAKRLVVGDILVNSTGVGTLGRTAPVRREMPETTVDSHITIVRPREGTDPEWLAYALGHIEDQIEAMAEGSTGQTELRREHLKTLRFQVPPLDVQRALADVLGALDDKIATNSAILSTSESLASIVTQAADSYSDAPLGDVADFHNRRRVPLSANQRSERVGNIPYYGANGQMATVDEALFDQPIVLLGEDGSVVREDGRPFVHYIWGPSWVNNHAHVLTGRSISTELLSVLLRESQVETLVTGAVQPKLSMGNAKQIRLRVPDGSALAAVEARIGDLYSLRRTTFEQTQTLETLRDTLLPPLMSGRLRVRDAERVVSEVV